MYFEFDFDEALVEVVTNRPNGSRDRLAPDGSKTVAQEFGEGLPEIGERQHAGEVLINRDEPKDIQSTQPLPTIPLPRRSLQCASLPVASFEAPLSCLRAHPKHQGLRRSARAAAVAIAIQSLGRASISMIFFCCSSFSELRTSLAK